MTPLYRGTVELFEEIGKTGVTRTAENLGCHMGPKLTGNPRVYNFLLHCPYLLPYFNFDLFEDFFFVV